MFKEIVRKKPMVYTDQEGGILYHAEEDGYSMVVVNIFGNWPCIYISFPGIENVKDYDDVLIDCHVHGGFSYFGNLTRFGFDKDKLWLGWDYAHAGDGDSYDKSLGRSGPCYKYWTTDELVCEGWDVLGTIMKGGWKIVREE